jgi:hypothetical protein
MVAGSYQGTLHITPADVTSTLSLTHIKQVSRENSGYLALGPELLGDGLFTGTVDTCAGYVWHPSARIGVLATLAIRSHE